MSDFGQRRDIRRATVIAVGASEGFSMGTNALTGLMVVAASLLWVAARASSDEERQVVANLDIEYQAAVKRNDAYVMDSILHKNMILVLGSGRTSTRDELLQEARDKTITYDRQDEDPGTQTVRMWGDTAVVTARLWIKGVSNGVAFDRRLWFSDTYVRTRDGWRYVFGQASLHLAE